MRVVDDYLCSLLRKNENVNDAWFLQSWMRNPWLHSRIGLKKIVFSLKKIGKLFANL